MSRQAGRRTDDALHAAYLRRIRESGHLLAGDPLGAGGELDSHHLFHAARAELLRRLGRFDEAADGYRRALSTAADEAGRRCLARRVAEVQITPERPAALVRQTNPAAD